LGSPLKALLTVAVDTPDLSATSLIVGDIVFRTSVSRSVTPPPLNLCGRSQVG
jgi:hypothetical protein